MSRELLMRVIAVWYGKADDNLLGDIQAELEKPKPVECGWIDTRYGILYSGWMTDNLGTGKYRLLAEMIDD